MSIHARTTLAGWSALACLLGSCWVFYMGLRFVVGDALHSLPWNGSVPQPQPPTAWTYIGYCLFVAALLMLVASSGLAFTAARSWWSARFRTPAAA